MPDTRERDECKADPLSQGNRLTKDAIADQGMKGALFSDVHSAAQFFFQIDEQPPGEPWWRMRTSLDQQVQVAILAGIAPREGTEYAHTLDAMPGGDSANPGALAQLVQCHALPFSHPPGHPAQDWAISPNLSPLATAPR